MLLFSDVAWNGLFGAVATIIVAWIVHRKGKIQEVKIDKVTEVARQTLTHVNSGKELQLKLNAISSRRLSDLTKNHIDIEAADLAEKLLAEHQKEQAQVDSEARDRQDAAALKD